MKFLYFKDADVFGPLEVSALAKEPCFSAEILVCPEDKSDDQSSWKFAKDYPEFKEFLVNSSTQPTSIAEPQDLPALEDTATEHSTDFNKENPFTNDIGNKGEIDSKNSEFTTELINIPQSYTFHVDHKVDNPQRTSGASLSALDTSQEDISKGNISKTDKDAKAEDALTMQRLEEAIADEDSFLEISNNKIISSSDGRVKKTKKNDLIFILSFVVITIVAIAICFAFLNMKRNKEESYNQVSAGQSLTEENPLSVPSPVTETVPAVVENTNITEPVKENTYEDQAIEIVKNTVIKSKGKTIDAYLKELYGTDYKYSWSAKPFTAKTYIVEFFASQVRSEPFVYLFRVDIDEKEITGALNNITLDLLA